MKKIVIILTILYVSFTAYSQRPTLKTIPADVDALTENVTLLFDVTGTSLEGITDLYIWSWCNDIKSGPTEMKLCYNGSSADWGNVSENAKLTYVEGNTYKIQLPITVTRDEGEVTYSTIADLFGFTENPGGIRAFGFLLRSKSGDPQASGEDFNLTPLVFEEALFRTFPTSVSNTDVITISYNMNLSTNYKMLSAKEISATITLLDDNNNVLIKAANIPCFEERDKEYSCTFLAEKLGDFPSGKSIDDVVVLEASFSGIIETNGIKDKVDSDTFSKSFSVFE
uniref:hypothetical protein n=1 Tax=uncultured Draconibacterium sp. TaxID=1573823 RepID=UPI003216BC6C